MSTPAIIRPDFNYAARDVAHDPDFSERPSLRIPETLFQEILAPIRKVFENDRIYTQKKNLDVPNMLEEMRYMISEAQTAQNTKDSYTRERGNDLLNTVQNIKECAEEGVDENGMRAADMDFFSLHELTDVIRKAAMTHLEYLHNEDIHDALMGVAENIDGAHKRLWQPKASLKGIDVADDYKPASQHIDEVKADITPNRLKAELCLDVAMPDDYAALNAA